MRGYKVEFGVEGAAEVLLRGWASVEGEAQEMFSIQNKNARKQILWIVDFKDVSL